MYRTVVAVLTILEKYILAHNFEEVLPKLYKTQIFDSDKLMKVRGSSTYLKFTYKKVAFGIRGFARDSISHFRRTYLIEFWKKNPPKNRNTSNFLTTKALLRMCRVRQLTTVTFEFVE